MKHLVMLLLAGTFLVACSSDNGELLIGKWREIETGSSLMEFNQNGTYTTSFDDGTKEKGKWHVDGDQLFTKSQGTDEEFPQDIAELTDEKLIVQVSAFGMTLQTKYKREN